jgi:hypothetical protein
LVDFVFPPPALKFLRMIVPTVASSHRMNNTHKSVAASSAGDLLILRGPEAALVLYAQLPKQSAAEITGTLINNRATILILQTMVSAAGSFVVLRKSRPPTSSALCLCLEFALKDGRKIAFTSQTRVTPRDISWFNRRGVSLIANSPLALTSS